MLDKKLNFLQWNCQSAVAKKEHLEYLLHRFDIHVALLSETWFKPGVYYKFSKYDLIRLDRVDGRAGVAILVRSDLNYAHLNNLPVIDKIMYVAIKIAISGNKYLPYLRLPIY